MKETTITKAEKQLVKGLIMFALENGYTIDDLFESEFENQIRKITGNNHYEHRNAMELYIHGEIVKLKEKYLYK